MRWMVHIRNRNDAKRQWNWIVVWVWRQCGNCVKEWSERNFLSSSEWCRRIRTMELMCAHTSKLTENNNKKTAPMLRLCNFYCLWHIVTLNCHRRTTRTNYVYEKGKPDENRRRDATKENKRKKNKAIKTHIIYPNEVKWSCSETMANLSGREKEKHADRK